MPAPPRLRMFAGPNGSGKSTLKSVLAPELLGVYLNPDEIEVRIRSRGALDISEFCASVTDGIGAAAIEFLTRSELLRRAGVSADTAKLSASGCCVDFSRVPVTSYHASVVADFLRRQLMEQRASFTVETVMSSPDKIDLLSTAQGLGYRTYLYFIATEDPDINISRVANRVRQGGHDVPRDKIVARYERSIGLLKDAVRRSNRAYIFDNSGHDVERVWLAEVTDGHRIEIKTDRIPAWFKEALLSHTV